MFEKQKNKKGAKRGDEILGYPATEVLYGPADALGEDCLRRRCFWRCTG